MIKLIYYPNKAYHDNLKAGYYHQIHDKSTRLSRFLCFFGWHGEKTQVYWKPMFESDTERHYRCRLCHTQLRSEWIETLVGQKRHDS